MCCKSSFNKTRKFHFPPKKQLSLLLFFNPAFLINELILDDLSDLFKYTIFIIQGRIVFSRNLGTCLYQNPVITKLSQAILLIKQLNICILTTVVVISSASEIRQTIDITGEVKVNTRDAPNVR